MSDETLRLLTSSEAVTGYLVGLIAVLAVCLWWVLVRRPVPAAGMAVTVAGAVALDRVYDAPTELLLGLVLLAAAGLVPTTSTIAVMAVSLPGAAVLAYTYVDGGRPELIILVVVATVLLSPLVDLYDRGQRNGDAVTLLVVSYVGVLIIVPDTDLAIVIVAAALPMFAVGFPLRMAHLGRSGSLAATGLLMWTVASGGAARAGALIAGVAALGLLLADPVARAWRGVALRPPVAPPGVFVVQAANVIGLALVVGFAAQQPVLVALVAAAALLVLGLWTVGPS